MLKLRDLDACFVSNATEMSFHEQESIEGAQGVMFVCPLCKNHSVLCWFKNPRNAPAVPKEMEPGPGRWTAFGSGIEDLTLNPSVNLDVYPTVPDAGQKPCRWHGWVRNGEAA
jgi:hypothetical protein